MANHPNRGRVRPAPAPTEIRAARDSVGHTLARAAETVFVTLNAWQKWESGDRPMPPGLRELYSLKTGAPMYAVYVGGEAIYGVGESIAAALLDADMGPLVGMQAGDSYAGGVVDLSAAHRIRPDSEVCAGADARLRRCSVRLAQSVLDGNQAAFEVRPDGVLDLLDDDE